MIHEVVGVEAKLQLLALPDIEVLEQSQVGVEVSRSIDNRQSSRSVLADLIGECEAARVDELMRREIRSRVAGNDRRKRTSPSKSVYNALSLIRSLSAISLWPALSCKMSVIARLVASAGPAERNFEGRAVVLLTDSQDH